MNYQVAIEIGQWIFLLYFILLNMGYLTLNLLSMINISRMMRENVSDELSQIYSGFETPITLLMPAYNEQSTIAASIRSLLQLSYPQYEILVINDGSIDNTLTVLQREFSLVPFPETYRARIATQPVRGIYHSTVFPNLRVIDKENGGKADSLNAGINVSRYPLFCAVDADSVLQRDSLHRVAKPFLEDSSVIACGGSIRIANGCHISGGFLEKIGLPKSFLARVQIVEYLRAFLFGRMGWSPINAMLIISGAFGLFKKDAVVDVGGYRVDTIGEDMELVVRLHRLYRLAKKPYKIVFVPDPICWTEAPENLKTLRLQRTRWQRGLAESLSMNIGLLFHPKGGTVGWLAFPFTVVFEWLGPLLEVTGYLFMFLLFYFGMISSTAFWVFLLVAIGFGLLLSMSALLLEEMSFHVYPRASQLLWLMLAAFVENFGYRQLTSVWRLMGLLSWLFFSKGRWGAMKRNKVLADEGR
jgi:cellulose synthase/poly-beta-1,6-N-acetylglucosamine synthase-like glycosyltransferase